LFGGLFPNLKSNATELNSKAVAIGFKLLVAEELTSTDRKKLTGKRVRTKYKKGYSPKMKLVKSYAKVRREVTV
jgi:hypothetical protein